MTKILLLTAGYGEGHNTAARALEAAFNEHSPAPVAEVVDVFALRAPQLNRLSRRAYLGLINRAPRIWAGVYRWLDRSPHAPQAFRALASHKRLLARLIAGHQPDAIVSTYPVYPWLLRELRRDGRLACPHFTVVTDALTINSLWFRAPSDGWFVTDEDSARLMHAAGVPPQKINVSGFPVARAFADRPDHWQPPEPFLGGPKRILFIINSGRPRALATARALLRCENWHITFTTGRDETLRSEIAALARGAPASSEVLGWTDRIPELLMTHHVAISKAGGATTQESISALCPLLVNQIVPGQEEGNYELLRRAGAGALTETPHAVVATLHAAFEHDARLWLQWRANLRRLARPDAARDIAKRVLRPAANYSAFPVPAITRKTA
ncbi:MAG: galactosyldiacylglycerol synthase [Opitutae bacterium]|nr:galactosyldiacylglycerol synthase [Opitutae bacterium]